MRVEISSVWPHRPPPAHGASRPLSPQAQSLSAQPRGPPQAGRALQPPPVPGPPRRWQMAGRGAPLLELLFSQDLGPSAPTSAASGLRIGGEGTRSCQVACLSRWHLHVVIPWSLCSTGTGCRYSGSNGCLGPCPSPHCHLELPTPGTLRSRFF